MTLASLAHVLVGTGSGVDTFDRSRLESRIDVGVPKTLTEGERSLVVDEVVRRAQTELERKQIGKVEKDGRTRIQPGQITRLTLDAFGRLAQRREIGDARERFKAAHAQFALAALGQANDLDQAWPSAHEFLVWIQDQYPELPKSPYIEQPPIVGRPKITWYPPSSQRPTTPHTVVKNFRPDRDSAVAPDVIAALAHALSAQRPAEETAQLVVALGQAMHVPESAMTADQLLPATAGPAHRRQIRRRETVDFDPAKVRDTLTLAFQGRSGRRPRIVSETFEWVLWGLIGQTAVRSSQISASIAEALRAIDDIAYLRWTSIGKELSLAQIHAEAEMLLVHPSPRLVLHPAGAGTPRTLLNTSAPEG